MFEFANGTDAKLGNAGCGIAAPFFVAAATVPAFVGYRNFAEPETNAGCGLQCGEYGRVATECADDATKSVKTSGDDI